MMRIMQTSSLSLSLSLSLFRSRSLALFSLCIPWSATTYQHLFFGVKVLLHILGAKVLLQLYFWEVSTFLSVRALLPLMMIQVRAFLAVLSTPTPSSLASVGIRPGAPSRAARREPLRISGAYMHACVCTCEHVYSWVYVRRRSTRGKWRTRQNATINKFVSFIAKRNTILIVAKIQTLRRPQVHQLVRGSLPWREAPASARLSASFAVHLVASVAVRCGWRQWVTVRDRRRKSQGSGDGEVTRVTELVSESV